MLDRKKEREQSSECYSKSLRRRLSIMRAINKSDITCKYTIFTDFLQLINKKDKHNCDNDYLSGNFRLHLHNGFHIYNVE
jgi:hypothetical protein